MQGATVHRTGRDQRWQSRARATSKALLWLGIAWLCGVAQGAVAVRRHVVAGGGGAGGNGAITLRGTTGQSSADLLDANAASLHVQGGYWAVASLPDDRIFANGFEP